MMMAPAFLRKSVGKLDAYTANLWMAGGVDLLIGGYPYSMLVENTSDGRDTTIMMGPDGTLNSGQLLGHSPSAGTVQAFLDQGPSARHFLNGTSSGQPAIVASSAYLGWVQFDASNDTFGGAPNYSGVAAITVFMKGKLRTTSSVQFLIEHSNNYNSNNSFAVYYDNAISRLVVGSHRVTGSQYAISEFNVTVTTEAVFCFRVDRAQTTGAAQCVLFLNGTKQTRSGSTGETGTVPSGNFDSAALSIASRNAASLFASLNLKTLAIYNAALSDADCTAISALL